MSTNFYFQAVNWQSGELSYPIKSDGFLGDPSDCVFKTVLGYWFPQPMRLYSPLIKYNYSFRGNHWSPSICHIYEIAVNKTNRHSENELLAARELIALGCLRWNGTKGAEKWFISSCVNGICRRYCSCQLYSFIIKIITVVSAFPSGMHELKVIIFWKSRPLDCNAVYVPIRLFFEFWSTYSPFT